MGIAGLLPFLKKASREVNLKSFAGSTVAVDAYCWLHKGAYSCAEKLAMKEETEAYIHYCLKYVKMLLDCRFKVIMVFDGCNLPAKCGVEKERRENRERNLRKAKDCLLSGDNTAAREYFTRCINITPHMAHKLIQACREINVDCIVAPYEADAQLAYLSKSGIAQIIISEDSDLVLYGCSKVLFKMDLTGRGVMVDSAKLGDCFGSACFTEEKFRRMCIMSGCDYLDSLPGIGLAKSHKFFTKVQNPNLEQILPKIPSYLNMPKVVVPEDYVSEFRKAENTFLYQLVYDPRKRQLRPLCHYDPCINSKELGYCGRYVSDKQAFDHSVGNLNINTKELIDDFSPEKAEKQLKDKKSLPAEPWLKSIWSKDYRPMDPEKIVIDLEAAYQSNMNKSRQVDVGVPKHMIKIKQNSNQASVLKKRKQEVCDDPEDDLMAMYAPVECKESKRLKVHESSELLNNSGRDPSMIAIRSRFFSQPDPELPEISSSPATKLSVQTPNGRTSLTNFSWKADIKSNYSDCSLGSLTSSPASQGNYKLVRPRSQSGSSQGNSYTSSQETVNNCSIDTGSFGFSDQESVSQNDNCEEVRKTNKGSCRQVGMRRTMSQPTVNRLARFAFNKI